MQQKDRNLKVDIWVDIRVILQATKRFGWTWFLGTKLSMFGKFFGAMLGVSVEVGSKNNLYQFIGAKLTLNILALNEPI